jgi:DNA-binding CsgD family transcriptional regulator
MMHMDTGSSAPDGRFRIDLPLMEALLQIDDADEAEIRLDRIRVVLESRDWPISHIGLHWMTSLQPISKRDLPAALIAATSAVDLAARFHRRGDHLLALLQRARILSRMRGVALARDDLSAARRLFEQAGIGGLRPHLDAASTEKSDVVSPTRLTTAEGRVEVLVRHGQSNREIATALCVSVRTVESHVSAILRKTGSASRFKLIARI